MSSTSVKVGIIGGTGLDDPGILEERREKKVTTPFGDPSDALILGKINGVDCVLLARHGRKHHVDPTHVNYRANIYALKAEGCTHVVVTNAVGSLQEHIRPGHIVLLDQFIDRTYRRESSFFDDTCREFPGVGHIPMDTPYCPHLCQVMKESLDKLKITYHPTGTIVICEGPRFSTKAESHMHRSWGAHLVGMTSVPEVCLAKEAGLLYAAAALVTDYDVWREEGGKVCVDMVMETMKKNASVAKSFLLDVIPRIGAMDWSAHIAEAQATVKNCIM